MRSESKDMVSLAIFGFLFFGGVQCDREQRDFVALNARKVLSNSSTAWNTSDFLQDPKSSPAPSVQNSNQSNGSLAFGPPSSQHCVVRRAGMPPSIKARACRAPRPLLPEPVLLTTPKSINSTTPSTTVGPSLSARNNDETDEQAKSAALQTLEASSVPQSNDSLDFGSVLPSSCNDQRSLYRSRACKGPQAPRPLMPESSLVPPTNDPTAMSEVATTSSARPHPEPATMIMSQETTQQSLTMTRPPESVLVTPNGGPSAVLDIAPTSSTRPEPEPVMKTISQEITQQSLAMTRLPDQNREPLTVHTQMEPSVAQFSSLTHLKVTPVPQLKPQSQTAQSPQTEQSDWQSASIKAPTSEPQTNQAITRASTTQQRPAVAIAQPVSPTTQSPVLLKSDTVPSNTSVIGDGSYQKAGSTNISDETVPTPRMSTTTASTSQKSTESPALLKSNFVPSTMSTIANGTRRAPDSTGIIDKPLPTLRMSTAASEKSTQNPVPLKGDTVPSKVSTVTNDTHRAPCSTKTSNKAFPTLRMSTVTSSTSHNSNLTRFAKGTTIATVTLLPEPLSIALAAPTTPTANFSSTYSPKASHTQAPTAQAQSPSTSPPSTQSVIVAEKVLAPALPPTPTPSATPPPPLFESSETGRLVDTLISDLSPRLALPTPSTPTVPTVSESPIPNQKFAGLTLSATEYPFEGVDASVAGMGVGVVTSTLRGHTVTMSVVAAYRVGTTSIGGAGPTLSSSEVGGVAAMRGNTGVVGVVGVTTTSSVVGAAVGASGITSLVGTSTVGGNSTVISPSPSKGGGAVASVADHVVVSLAAVGVGLGLGMGCVLVVVL